MSMGVEQVISAFIAPFIKAFSPPVTTPIALGCAALMAMNYWKIYKLPEGLIPYFIIVGVLCASRSVTGFVSYLWSASSEIRLMLVIKFNEMRKKKEIERQLPFLSKDEKFILGYIFFKKINMITVSSDGDRAKTLISKGFLILPNKSPMTFVHSAVVYELPSYVWEILEKNTNLFPSIDVYEKAKGNPWITPWMAR